MSELVVRTSMGSLTAWHELAPAFTRLTGHKVIVAQEDAATTLDKVLASGAQSDLISLYGEPLNRIVKGGKTVGGSSTVFTRAAVGLSVKSGAPWPDDAQPARHWAYVKPVKPEAKESGVGRQESGVRSQNSEWRRSRRREEAEGHESSRRLAPIRLVTSAAAEAPLLNERGCRGVG